MNTPSPLSASIEAFNGLVGLTVADVDDLRKAVWRLTSMERQSPRDFFLHLALAQVHAKLGDRANAVKKAVASYNVIPRHSVEAVSNTLVTLCGLYELDRARDLARWIVQLEGFAADDSAQGAIILYALVAGDLRSLDEAAPLTVSTGKPWIARARDNVREAGIDSVFERHIGIYRDMFGNSCTIVRSLFDDAPPQQFAMRYYVPWPIKERVSAATHARELVTTLYREADIDPNQAEAIGLVVSGIPAMEIAIA